MDMFQLSTFKVLRKKINGLPTFCRALMLELFEYLDVKQGKIILSKTLAQLISEDFFVEPAPGRKAEKITPDTIRNAFRTIKKFRGEHFRFSTEGQRIVIEMPFIRELYEEHLKSQELTGEVAEARALENTGLELDLETQSTEEVTAVTSPNKNNIFINKNIKTTTTQPEAEFIADDFHPSDALIEKAKAQGYTKALDREEIQAFIDYNKARGSRWVDFNPVYFRWLQRGYEHQNHHQAKQHEQTRREQNGRYTHKQSTRLQPAIETAGERVRRHRVEKKQQAGSVIDGEYRVSMG